MICRYAIRTPLSFFLAALLFATALVVDARAQEATVRPAEPVCELPDAPFEGRRIMAAPVTAKHQKSATFDVNFKTSGTVFSYSCDPWPQEAKDAFLRATNTWAGLLESSVPIDVDACWTQDISGTTLASAGPYLVPSSYFAGSPKQDTYYPKALANAISGTEQGGSGPEILAAFNANRYPDEWYFGAAPAGIGDGEYDFETVALHELGHGLGFTGTGGYDGATDEGSLGKHEDDLPYAFDHFVQDDAGTAVLDFADPSLDLGTIFTGGSVSSGSGGIFFSGTRVVGANGGPAPLYTPSSWQPGSSYSHWDQDSFSSEMMRPQTPSGQALRDPQLALELLEDIGWAQALPVELSSFEAVADENAAVLTWATASETNNAGFEVQHARTSADAAWTTLTFIEGAGTTNRPQQYRFRVADLDPGTHRFRLRQVDVDGASELSPVVEVALQMDAPYRLSAPYPNPSRGTARMDLMVQQTQDVRAVLFDALGREVTVLHEGPMQANTPHTLRVEGANLASGLYLVRVSGTSFVTTRRVSVVK